MKNRITELFGIKYPIALAGMGGVGDAILSAAVSDAGGLGTIAAADETAQSLKMEIDTLRKLTGKPFAVNIPLMVRRVNELMQVILESNVPIVITAAGSPALFTAELKKSGVKVVHVVPCVDAAKKAENAGVDAIIAEGFESGGFGSPYEIGMLALIPQVVDAVRVPVLAAGGIVDARGYAACRILGAEGVSVGTAFLASVECTRIGSAWKDQIIRGNDVSTRVFARSISPVRMLVNKSTNKMDEVFPEGSSIKDLLDFIFSADRAGSEDAPFPCGQGVGLISKIRTVREIIDDFVNGSEMLLKKMAAENDT